jgi:histidinol dehydrogenase
MADMVEILYGKNVTPGQIRARFGTEYKEAEETVRAILDDVRQNGDAALFAYAKKFDRAELTSLLVSEQEIDEAVAAIDPAFYETLEQAAENIRDFHKRQVRQGFSVSERKGVLMGQRVMPLERVGLYVPGGTASYPSTVLMNAIPAKIAGVREIALATPPAPGGRIAAPILAAARIAGVERIYKMGGAQAIAAFAHGTESVRRVDKITGPGNMYVATAKRMVYGLVDIDMIAGPSEILVIADDSADPFYVAADLLSQAEHDAMAASILFTTSETLAKAVQSELSRQVALLPRREIAERSLRENGRIVIVNSLFEAADLSNEIAPEHLELCTVDPFSIMGLIRHAGSIFLGNYAPEALGDYFAGPNHTLPTNGAARFSSPLSVDDFVKKSSFLYYTREALCAVQERIADFAEREGLSAHARSVRIRFEGEDEA